MTARNRRRSSRPADAQRRRRRPTSERASAERGGTIGPSSAERRATERGSGERGGTKRTPSPERGVTGRVSAERRATGRVDVPHTSAAGKPAKRLASASAPLLLRLHRLPGWVVPLAILLLCLVGLLAKGVVAFLCLATIAAFLGWLLLLSWHAITPATRLLRLLAVTLVAAAAVAKLL